MLLFHRVDQQCAVLKPVRRVWQCSLGHQLVAEYRDLDRHLPGLLRLAQKPAVHLATSRSSIKAE